jgi:hypothetical protein
VHLLTADKNEEAREIAALHQFAAERREQKALLFLLRQSKWVSNNMWIKQDIPVCLPAVCRQEMMHVLMVPAALQCDHCMCP